MDQKHRKAVHRKDLPKDQSLSARLSAEAKAGLKAAADAAGVSLNEYLEQLGLNYSPPTTGVLLSGELSPN